MPAHIEQLNLALNNYRLDSGAYSKSFLGIAFLCIFNFLSASIFATYLTYQHPF